MIVEHLLNLEVIDLLIVFPAGTQPVFCVLCRDKTHWYTESESEGARRSALTQGLRYK